ncbi:ORF030R [Infectious spleen and kidney necrosis virus]|uniref:ORF030R n=4 Tax=Infectious spleen and kidney necrosis virus TaxID=180170 RepID=Q8QUT0_ISKNN|nr:ORF030R [Infectious spleen and kidney necrosis virus]AAL98754.1 ORF030R [Infectious spleen and kidney necrosis virus]
MIHACGTRTGVRNSSRAWCAPWQCNVPRQMRHIYPGAECQGCCVHPSLVLPHR